MFDWIRERRRNRQRQLADQDVQEIEINVEGFRRVDHGDHETWYVDGPFIPDDIRMAAIMYTFRTGKSVATEATSDG